MLKENEFLPRFSFKSFLIIALFSLPFIRNIRLSTYMSLQDLFILLGSLRYTLANIEYLQKKKNSIFLILSFIIILFLGTTLFTTDIFHNTVNICKIINCYIFFPALLQELIVSSKDVRMAVWSFSFAASLSAIGQNTFLKNIVSSSNNRTGGLVGDAVFYGIILAFSFVLVFLNFNDRKQKFSITRVILGCVIFWGIIGTSTVSAILVILIFMLSIIFEHSIYTVIWGGLFATICLTLLISIPWKMYNIRTFNAVFYLPKGIWLMFKALVSMKGANKTFIHTEHGTINKEK